MTLIQVTLVKIGKFNKTKKINMGICALYGTESDLKKSHSFPKFVVEHMKNTGGGFIRRGGNVNSRIQDILKIELLCSKAEQEFGKRENWFRNEIFYPYLDGKKSFSYDSNLYYFSISFLWRILQYEYHFYNLENKWFYPLIKQVDNQWKKYLIDKTIPVDFHNINLFFINRDDIRQNQILQGIDSYLTRVMDQSIVHSNNDESKLIVYAKFNRFIFWSVIRDYEVVDQLYDVEIHPKTGTFDLPQDDLYAPLGNFLIHRIQETNNLFEKISAEQSRKINEQWEREGYSFFETDAGMAFLNDLT